VGEAIGMHAGLDFAVGTLERFAIQLESRPEPEELEMVRGRTETRR
jgi:hypothetical protein